MSSKISATAARLSVVVILAFVAAVTWTGCGGGSNNNMGGGNNSPAPQSGGSQPGPGGSGGSGSSGASYLYAAIAIDTGGVRGYKVDASSAGLTEVPGSPSVLQGAETGALAISRNFIYTSNLNNTSDFSLNITEFRADSSSGSLTKIGTVNVARTSGSGNAGPGALTTDPSGHNLYALTNNGDISIYTINGDGTLTSVGTNHLAVNGGVPVISPNGQLAYMDFGTGNPKSGTFSNGVMALNRDPGSGSFTINHQVSSGQDLHDLQFDPSGKFLAAVSGNNSDHISVFVVNYSTGDITPVPGSPFASTGSSPAPGSGTLSRTLRFDPSGKFLYLLNSSNISPRPESISVYAFNQGSGALTPVQTMDLGSGPIGAGLVADQSLLFVINDDSGPTLGSIMALKRDANTGMLSAPNTTNVSTPLGAAGEVHF